MNSSIKLVILLFTSSICGMANAQVKINFKFHTPYRHNPVADKFRNNNGAKILKGIRERRTLASDTRTWR